VIEQAASRTRSISRNFQSIVEDKPWFNDRSFWSEYLTMLAALRFNRFQCRTHSPKIRDIRR